jgi:hypothetical protein
MLNIGPSRDWRCLPMAKKEEKKAEAKKKK